jgi:ribose transport system permease protein
MPERTPRNSLKLLPRVISSIRLRRLAEILGQIPSGAILFIVVLALFGAVVPEFLSIENLTNILLAGSPLALFTLGMSLVMLANGIDLSIGTCTSFVSVLTASLLGSGWPIGFSLGLGILAAVLVGLGNGVMIFRLKLPAFIVTLGTMGLTTGLALLIGGGQTLYWDKNWFNNIALNYWLGLPLVFWVFLILFAAVGWILHQTAFGRYIYGIGCNEEALRLCGVKIGRYTIAIYVLNGFCVGIAALMITSRVASGNPIIGVGLEFEAVAAAAIGGISFMGGKGHPAFAVISAITITMLLNGLGLIGFHTSIQYVFVGLILIVGMSMNILIERLFPRRMMK